MSGNNPLGALASSTASLFNTFLPVGSTSLFNRVNLVYGLFFAGLSYCAYNLYRVYQYTQHTSYGLNDNLKLAKCHALYAKAKEKDCQGVQSLLLQCEEILVSITDEKLLKDKEELLVKLAKLHAQYRNLEYAYKLAESLSLSDNIFNVAISLLIANFDATRLDDLIIQAFEAKKQENKQLDVDTLLMFAKSISSSNLIYANGIVKNAKELANSLKETLPKIRALCQIAQCLQERGNLEGAKIAIETARTHFLDGKTTSAEDVEIRLVLADAFFSARDFENMNIELKAVRKLITEKTQPAKNVYLLAKLQNKIKNTAKVDEKFKSFDFEKLISPTMYDLAKNLSDGNRAEDCLTLASMYQEGFLEESDKKQNVLDKAFEYIDLLRESTDEDIKSKIDLLERLSSFDNSDVRDVVISKLVTLYNKKNQSDRDSKIQAVIASKILKIYNKEGLEQQSGLFLQECRTNLENTNANACDKIGQLVAFAEHIDHGGHLTTEQMVTQLKAAEALLPQLDPSISYEGTLALIAKGYSQIDPQKSLELLGNYQDKQAKSCKITAAVSAALSGITYFYPGPGLLLSGAYAVSRRMGLL